MSSFSESITRTAGRLSLRLTQASPHLLFGAGLVGVVGAGVLACRATLKAQPAIDKLHEDIDAVQSMRETSVKIGTKYADQEYFRDGVYVVTRNAMVLGKIYGPSLVVGGLSIAALTGSHLQLTRRNAALTVTLAAVGRAYAEYRSRVREVVGTQRELEIYQGIKEVEVVTEDGRIELQKKPTAHSLSPYAVCFDEQSSAFSRGHQVNSQFVQGVQMHCNDRLKARGHLFLNEVYEYLGLPLTEAGQIVGWMWNGDGDNFVDFGLSTPANMDFVYGSEKCAWLDFNVDGPIHTKFAG
jgi:hypothetical protein